jgi:four helix bundle protein
LEAFRSRNSFEEKARRTAMRPPGRFLSQFFGEAGSATLESRNRGRIGKIQNSDFRFQNAKLAQMKAVDLKDRTKQFALQTIRFCESLPKDDTSKTIGRQLLRSGTSVAANYRAVCRSKSTPDFLSKFAIVLEEADESAFWIELLVEAGKMSRSKAEPLLKEANELVAISAASLNTARRNARS